MSGISKIEWCNATWNPVTGCTRVSEGCRNCWAARLAATRLRNHPRYRGLATYPDLRGVVPSWTGEVRTHPGLLAQTGRLDHPLHWHGGESPWAGKPRRIFVCSQADLFHERVPDEFIADVFAVMSLSTKHVFQLLTKRPRRMAELIQSKALVHLMGRPHTMEEAIVGVCGEFQSVPSVWPLPNVWLGVSVEDQKTADERIPLLLQTPTAAHWISYEPALASVNLQSSIGNLQWVVAGGESGPNARPSHPEWFRVIRNQCEAAGVPYFHKQNGEWLHSSQMDADQVNRALEIHGKNPERVHLWPDGKCSVRIGKKYAGRLLDEREWNEFPRIP